MISKKSFEYHINKLDKVLNKLKQNGFKVNAEKSFYDRNELEYLGFKIARQAIIPLPHKVEANIAVPTANN